MPTHPVFARFMAARPEMEQEILFLERAVDQLEDPAVRDRIRNRIALELGVMLLEREEVGSTLAGLFGENGETGNSV